MSSRPPRFRVLRQRPRGSSRATTATGSRTSCATLSARGRARLDRLRRPPNEGRRRRRGLVGLGVRVSPPRQRPRRDARGTRPARRPRRSRRRAQSALCAGAPTCAASPRPRSPRRPSPTPSSSSSPCPSRVSARSSPHFPGDAPLLSLTKGLDPATGERLSTLVRGRPVAVLSGPNIADEIAPRPSRSRCRRERRSRARRPAPARGPLGDLPRRT